MRLCEQTLSSLPASVRRPSYNRDNLEIAIIHLGVGAFHRAHQAFYTESVLDSGDLRWGIAGANINSSSAQKALAPQDGLFSLTERDSSRQTTAVIGALRQVYGAGDLPHVLELMCNRSIKIVSLTITEKGYYLDPATRKLNLEAAPIKADLANPEKPQSAVGMISYALSRRRKSGIPPFTVLCCDNLPSNGKLARNAVVGFASRLDEGLARWIESEVAFPCTMVDRITPATTDEDRAAVANVLGMEDSGPVVTEKFTQWVIEDKFTLGRPDWDIGGAIFSNELETWENMKLRCLNGAHSTLAYLGQLFGCETVADAMQSELITKLLDELWLEIRQLLQAPKHVSSAEYVESLKNRFRNPHLRHLTIQIATDGSQKLPPRLLTTLRERMAQGLSSPAIETALAGWMHFVAKCAYSCSGFPALNDPMKGELTRLALISPRPTDIVANLLSCTSIFGDLSQSTTLGAGILSRYEWLLEKMART